MTYRLTPRCVQAGADSQLTLAWDNHEEPLRDLVVAKPISVHNFPESSEAFVKVHRDLLQDYATLRGCHLVQFYYEQRWSELTDEIRSLLGSSTMREFMLEGRTVELCVVNGADLPVLNKVWGVCKLVDPGSFPVPVDAKEYGQLRWPGIPGLVSGDLARASSSFVYVRDTVLETYEETPEFSINPEAGSVEYGNQWGVGYCSRLGRDVIQVELRKLYEGTPPRVVRHWNRHAIDPPAQATFNPRGATNIASRAKRIVYAVVSLGEALARLSARLLADSCSALEFVGLERNELNYRGWWVGPIVEPLTRTARWELKEEAFLGRSVSLQKLVVEGLEEARVRRLVDRVGVPVARTKDLRSLKLLDLLVQLFRVSNETGLELIRDREDVVRRWSEISQQPSLRILFALNDLRTIASHHGGRDVERRVDAALEELGLSRAACASGWGQAVDSLYDHVAAELESIGRIVRTVIHP